MHNSSVERDEQTDVLIVGGGLSTAWNLLRRAPGLDLVLVESAVLGRTLFN